MNNNTDTQYSPFQKAKIDFFYKGLTQQLHDSIDPELISPLSNMLAFHFANIDDLELNQVLYDIIARIKKYLGMRIIAVYDFSVVLTLFSISITKDDVLHEDMSENLQEIYTKDEILSELIADFQEGDILEIYKKFINIVLQEEDAACLLNYIHANKTLSQNMYTQLEASPKYKDKTLLHNDMIRIIRHSAEMQASHQEFRNILNMTCAIVIAATSSYLCISQFGLIAPFFIMPMTLYGIKLIINPVDRFIEKSINLISALGDSKKNIASKTIDCALEYHEAIDRSKLIVTQDIRAQINKIMPGVARYINQDGSRKQTSAEAEKKAQMMRNRITNKQ